MEFTKMPSNVFKALQLNAGVLAREFDPSTGTIAAENIMGATSGGVNFVAEPSFTDFGEDIDNCPTNMLELKRLDTWEVTMSGSFVSFDGTLLKDLVGLADSEEVGSGDTAYTKVTPRNDLLTTDFGDVWWIGDYSDVNTGDHPGFLAVHLINALSTSGINIQSEDSEKGTLEFEFTGHYSIDDQDQVPYEIYVKSGTEGE